MGPLEGRGIIKCLPHNPLRAHHMSHMVALVVVSLGFVLPPDYISKGFVQTALGNVLPGGKPLPTECYKHGCSTMKETHRCRQTATNNNIFQWHPPFFPESMSHLRLCKRVVISCLSC